MTMSAAEIIVACLQAQALKELIVHLEAKGVSCVELSVLTKMLYTIEIDAMEKIPEELIA